jgi:hypothetical protein
MATVVSAHAGDEAASPAATAAPITTVSLPSRSDGSTVQGRALLDGRTDTLTEIVDS